MVASILRNFIFILIAFFSSFSAFAQRFDSRTLDQGYEDSQTWLDINFDGWPDFCRLVGENGLNGILSCTLSNSGTPGATFFSARFDGGYKQTREIYRTENGVIYCREVGEKGRHTKVCTVFKLSPPGNLNAVETFLFNELGRNAIPFLHDKPYSLKTSKNRSLEKFDIDINFDGWADICQVVEISSGLAKIVCYLNRSNEVYKEVESASFPYGGHTEKKNSITRDGERGYHICSFEYSKIDRKRYCIDFMYQNGQINIESQIVQSLGPPSEENKNQTTIRTPSRTPISQHVIRGNSISQSSACAEAWHTAAQEAIGRGPTSISDCHSCFGSNLTSWQCSVTLSVYSN